MLDWQKSTAPDRAELERNAERVGITRSDVADYFKRLDSEWDNHDERITSNCGDKAQFMCDGANWLAEQIEAIRNIPKSLRPHYRMPRLETPFEHGDVRSGDAPRGGFPYLAGGGDCHVPRTVGVQRDFASGCAQLPGLALFPLRATVRILAIRKPLMPVVWHNGIVFFIFPFRTWWFKKGYDGKSRLEQKPRRYVAFRFRRYCFRIATKRPDKLAWIIDFVPKLNGLEVSLGVMPTWVVCGSKRT